MQAQQELGIHHFHTKHSFTCSHPLRYRRFRRFRFRSVRFSRCRFRSFRLFRISRCRFRFSSGRRCNVVGGRRNPDRQLSNERRLVGYQYQL
jgi:hypothetical protein